MRKIYKLMIATVSLLCVFAAFDTSHAQAPSPNLCKDGQEMIGNRGCVCRPPLKFLPGNICGSGVKKAQPDQPGVTPYRGIQCKPGQNTASGCQCASPLYLFPAGRCDYPPKRGSKCAEGQDAKSTGCVCEWPLRRVGARCLRPEGRIETKGACVHGQPVYAGCVCAKKVINGKCNLRPGV